MVFGSKFPEYTFVIFWPVPFFTIYSDGPLCYLRVQDVFSTGSALKVLNVGDGKISTKKVKVDVQRKLEALTQTFTFLVGVLQSPTLRTFGAEPVKKKPV